ncbi:MAG: response regulator [Proteobacteria bacterium]|nr:response regulator [Pseudomonadota bacterium]
MGDKNIPTVLIADDNKQTLDLLKKFFSRANDRGDLICDVIEATDGKEAIKMLDIAQPEIILCDIEMPGRDGFDVLKHFNEFSKKQNLYCFFCFLSAAPEEKKRAFQEGAMGFLSKKEINYYVMTLHIRAWFRLAQLERRIDERV